MAIYYGPPPAAPVRTSWTKRAITTFAAVVVFLATVYGVWTQATPVRQWACRSSVGNHLTRVCDEGDRTISVSDAHQFWLTYLAKLTAGAGPRGAWDLLTSGYQTSLSYPTLAATARQLEWSEPLGTATRTGGFNDFEVTYRFYYRATRKQSEKITVENEIISLTRVQGVIVMQSQTDDGRDKPDEYLTFPRPTLTRPVDTYALPRTSAVVNQRPTTPTYRGDDHVGGVVTALCNLQVRSNSVRTLGSDDIGWWTRIRQGWIQSSALAIDANEPTTPGPVPGLPTCDGSALNR